jgi:hypothetical protein
MSSDLVHRSAASLMVRETREVRALRRRTEYAQELIHGEAALTGTVIDDGAKLTLRAVNATTAIDSVITQASHGNPSLELSLRAFEDTFVAGARVALFTFMNR